LCLVTRAITSIYYIEDIDSLRFALSAMDYSVVEARPHFPGYPLYCFLLKIVYFFTGSVGLSFSLIGGFSTFIILYFMDRIWSLFTSINSNILLVIGFLCPLLWLMGNRYMPDIMGLALVMSAFYYFLKILAQYELKSILLLFLLLGALLGVRLSYAPFFIPVVFLLFRYPKKIPIMVITFLLSVLVWFVPWVFDSGWNSLLDVAHNNTAGHFTDWGGGIMSEEATYWHRFVKMIESIWADGLGAWWYKRHWITMVVGLIYSVLIFLGLRYIYLRRLKLSLEEKIVIPICILFYLFWVYFFQNIVYKPRHIMPFLPFIIFLCAFGIHELRKYSSDLFSKLLIGIFILALTIVSGVINWQHQTPTAIAQVENYVQHKKDSNTIFYSIPLINYYMSRHVGLKDMIYCTSQDQVDAVIKDSLIKYTVITTFVPSNHKRENQHVFFHNPYVNRLWYQIPIYLLKE